MNKPRICGIATCAVWILGAEGDGLDEDQIHTPVHPKTYKSFATESGQLVGRGSPIVTGYIDNAASLLTF